MHSEKRDISFGKRAEKYDIGFEGRMSRKFYDMLIDSIEINKGDKLLDVACGTGEILYRLHDKQVKEYGIDIDDKMLNVARRKCPEAGFQNGTCDSLPYEDEYFDVATTCMAYHHFDNRRGFEMEAGRVLKSGGYLYIADPIFPCLIRELLNGIFRCLNMTVRFHTAEEIAKNFVSSGFEMEKSIKSGMVQVVCLIKK